jgi:taurine dioxygenase
VGRQIATSNGYRVAPLAPDLNWGAQVLDLEPASVADPHVRKDLFDLWIQEGVIVFRHLKGEDAHLALSGIFGPLWAHPTPENRAKDRQDLIDVRHTKEDAWLTRVDGEVRGSYLPWHFDLVYMVKINRGGILRPVKLPQRLGDTGFIDRISAYDSLPSDVKSRIENLHVVYRYDMDPSHQRFGVRRKAEHVQYSKVAQKVKNSVDRGDYPDVLHPMVYVQNETGRKVLNISPWFATGIHEMPGAEGEVLLETVAQHIANENNAYFHHWQADDMVLWDNWRTLHCAIGAPAEEERHLRRTTIGGDYSLGRLAADAVGSEETRKYLHV